MVLSNSLLSREEKPRTVTIMNLNVEISDKLAPALKAKADECGVSPSNYVSQVLERDLRCAEIQAKPNEAPIWEMSRTS